MHALKKLMTTCAQRRKLAESKQIEMAGGYNFNIDSGVPSTFNFGGAQI